MSPSMQDDIQGFANDEFNAIPGGMNKGGATEAEQVAAPDEDKNE